MESQSFFRRIIVYTILVISLCKADFSLAVETWSPQPGSRLTRAANWLRGHIPCCTRAKRKISASSEKSCPEEQSGIELAETSSDFLHQSSENALTQGNSGLTSRKISNFYNLYSPLEDKYNTEPFMLGTHTNFIPKALITLVFSWGGAIPLQVLIMSVFNHLSQWPVLLTDPGASSGTGPLIIDMSLVHINIYLVPLFFPALYTFMWDTLPSTSPFLYLEKRFPKISGFCKGRKKTSIHAEYRNRHKKCKRGTTVLRFILAAGNTIPLIYLWYKTLTANLLNEIGIVSAIPFFIIQTIGNMEQTTQINGLIMTRLRSKSVKRTREDEILLAKRASDYIKNNRYNPEALNALIEKYWDRTKNRFNVPLFISNEQSKFAPEVPNKKISIPQILSGIIVGTSAYGMYNSLVFTFSKLTSRANKSSMDAISYLVASILVIPRLLRDFTAGTQYLESIHDTARWRLSKDTAHINNKKLRLSFRVWDIVEAFYYGSYILGVGIPAFGHPLLWGSLEDLPVGVNISLACMVFGESAYQYGTFNKFRERLITSLSRWPIIGDQINSHKFLGTNIKYQEDPDTLATLLLLKIKDYESFLKDASDKAIALVRTKKGLLRQSITDNPLRISRPHTPSV